MTLMISLAVNGLQSIGAEGVGIHGGWTYIVPKGQNGIYTTEKNS